MDRSRCSAWTAVCAAAAIAAWLHGCATTEETTSTPAEVSPGATALCPNCGHYRGSEQCCAEDLERCEGCGMAVGSPGCCMTK